MAMEVPIDSRSMSAFAAAFKKIEEFSSASCFPLIKT